MNKDLHYDSRYRNIWTLTENPHESYADSDKILSHKTGRYVFAVKRSAYEDE